RGGVLLNANESPWPPFAADDHDWNRYPDPQPAALVERLAGIYKVSPEQLLVGRGSDEAIDLLVRAFCEPGRDAVAISPPTFGMYAVCARVQDAEVLTVPLDDDFHVDVEALLSTIADSVKLVFLCTPNNPTGDALPLERIERIARELADRAMVVVDEAYIEFANATSASTLLGRHENLAVLRTLSKAWAMAGLRLGCLIANPEVIALVRRIMPPYPLPAPCVEAALAALSDDGLAEAKRRIATTVAERERLASALRNYDDITDVLPSRANFLTVRCVDSATLYRRLLNAGVVVRDVSHYPKLAQCLRFSIGTAIENDRLLETIRSGENI
ncbi:MAG: histidinol-phosphate transaminase, partial [Dokdonella sp.]